MLIEIKDDFDLHKITYSGQCFRAVEMENGLFRFITGNNVLYIKQESANLYEISCNLEEWTSVWADYFDLRSNYAGIRESIPASDSFLSNAALESRGIRILKQEKFETLISFIISQRKSIPAIKNSIDKICQKYGEAITTEYETVYAFPSINKLVNADTENLNACGLGYRTPYIQDAVKRVYSGMLDLDEIDKLSNEDLIIELKTVRGVGDKVANCTALFAYGRKSLAPVDVWIKKVIDLHYNGENRFLDYGDNAGIMQQYAFYYMQCHKNGD